MAKQTFKSKDEAVAFLRSCGVTCSPRQLAKVMGGQPYYYNVAARNGKLDYEFTWHGVNLRIYTESVIKRILAEKG